MNVAVPVLWKFGPEVRKNERRPSGWVFFLRKESAPENFGQSVGAKRGVSRDCYRTGGMRDRLLIHISASAPESAN